MRDIQRKKIKSNNALFTAAIWLLASLLCNPGFAYPDPDKVIICFYSSEANINNYKSLKMELDSYLSKFGRYEFQPFFDRENFEDFIKTKKDCILILSAWHYCNMVSQCFLEPVLFGVRNGKNCQKRVLVTKDAKQNSGNIFNGLATASSKEHTLGMLKQMVRTPLALDTVKLLEVPKEIDALMAVCFGMADSALTTINTFESLKLINPKLSGELKVVAESGEFFHLILAIPKSFEQNSESIVRVIEKMNMDPEGKEKISMMGLDSWEKITPSDRLKLECLSNAGIVR